VDGAGGGLVEVGLDDVAGDGDGLLLQELLAVDAATEVVDQPGDRVDLAVLLGLAGEVGHVGELGSPAAVGGLGLVFVLFPPAAAGADGREGDEGGGGQDKASGAREVGQRGGGAGHRCGNTAITRAEPTARVS
jgi:hypothetical protein